MYKNIIFDLGNVLINFKPYEYLMTKMIDTENVLKLHKEIFQGEEWILLDKGMITQKEAIDILIDKNRNLEPLIKSVFENWFELLTPIKETVEILKQLKNFGYKVYYLSNFHLLAFECVNRKFDFFNIFDGGIVSYKEKLVKPDANIYRRILVEYGIKPEESIFIDDVEVNIESARKHDFKTILFKNPKDLIKSLQDYGVRI